MLLGFIIVPFQKQQLATPQGEAKFEIQDVSPIEISLGASETRRKKDGLI